MDKESIVDVLTADTDVFFCLLGYRQWMAGINQWKCEFPGSIICTERN